MMEARAFLAGRRPPAPEALARWLERVPVEAGPVAEALTRAALGCLDRARAAPGRVRDSAFHLLAADALLTYACEAALDSEDPQGALDAILGGAAARER